MSCPALLLWYFAGSVRLCIWQLLWEASKMALEKRVLPATLVKCPMADGGEGTVESILAACEGELRRTTVRGPLGSAVDAAWGWLPHNHTAIIEMAEASGLQLVPPGKRDAASAARSAPAN